MDALSITIVHTPLWLCQKVWILFFIRAACSAHMTSKAIKQADTNKETKTHCKCMILSDLMHWSISEWLGGGVYVRDHAFFMFDHTPLLLHGCEFLFDAVFYLFVDLLVIMVQYICAILRSHLWKLQAGIGFLRTVLLYICQSCAPNDPLLERNKFIDGEIQSSRLYHEINQDLFAKQKGMAGGSKCVFF